MDRVGVPDGTSAYFRLSTRPLDQSLAALPEDQALLERRHRQAIAGGYRLSGDPTTDRVTLIGARAIMHEVVNTAAHVAASGVAAGVLCLTSPDLVFRSFQRRGDRRATIANSIIDELLPYQHRAP